MNKDLHIKRVHKFFFFQPPVISTGDLERIYFVKEQKKTRDKTGVGRGLREYWCTRKKKYQ